LSSSINVVSVFFNLTFETVRELIRLNGPNQVPEHLIELLYLLYAQAFESGYLNMISDAILDLL